MTTNDWMAQGALTITDGPTSASLTLFGQYLGAGLGVANDGHDDTLIASTPFTQRISIAVPHH